MSQRHALLDGARKCLVEKGYSRTTARDIATAAGAHLASIGYHFGSKDRLMNTAVLDATGAWGDQLEAAVRAVDAGDPPSRFAALVATLLPAIVEARDLHVAGVQALAQASFDDQLQQAMAAGARQGRTALAAVVLGIPPEQVDPATERRLGSLLYALVTGYVAQSLIDPDSMPTPAEVTGAIRTLSHPDP